MPDPVGEQAATYQVVLPGRFGPAYHQAFTALGVDGVSTCTVFRLAGYDEAGIPDVAAMLERRGLVILSIRRVIRDG
jgi:hypothetical protein